ncbi:MAG: glycosyltransferase family 2 protein [Acidimicrobiales bacterium]
MRLAVCVCTYRRPDVLERLLARLAECAEAVADRATVELVVVDDDHEGSAARVVDASRSAFPGGVRYHCSGSGNVAVARNHVLELGLDRAELLAMIDDDCWPVTEWLHELVQVQQNNGADLVAGACDTDLPPTVPKWLLDEPFFDEGTTGVDGSDTQEAYLKNLLVTAEFVQRHGLRFDLRFGTTGGEDAMFLHTAIVRGARMVFAAHAVVHEQMPEHRTTLRYQLRRRYWYGNTEALTSIASGRSTRSRNVARGLIVMASGVARPLVRSARRETPQWRFALSEVLRGGGRVLGGLGRQVSHR